MKLSAPLVAAALSTVMLCGPIWSPSAVAQQGAEPATVGPIGVRLATIRQISDFVREPANRVRTVEDFMDRLDPLLLQNYVLMECSNSRQQPSTVEFPRIILFRPDGRLFVGIATNCESEGYDDVELIEFTEDRNWNLGAIRLDPRRDARPTLHQGGPTVGGSCTECHGVSMRPIWGPYSRWTGAYADGVGHRLTPRQAEVLTAIQGDPEQRRLNPRLARLRFKRPSWKPYQAFELPDQHRGLTNEALNETIGPRQIDSLWERIQRVPRHELYLVGNAFRQTGLGLDETLRLRLLERIDRDWQASGLARDYPGATQDDHALLLLRLDGIDDLNLGARVKDFSAEERRNQHYLYQDWLYVNMFIGDLLTFRFISELADADEALRQRFRDTPFQGRFRSRSIAEYATLDDYRVDNATFAWSLDLQGKLAELARRTPPTVFLNVNSIFPENFQNLARPNLEALVARVLERFP